jgi:hypothetical protein
VLELAKVAEKKVSKEALYGDDEETAKPEKAKGKDKAKEKAKKK